MPRFYGLRASDATRVAGAIVIAFNFTTNVQQVIG